MIAKLISLPKKALEGIRKRISNVFVGKNLYAYVTTPYWRKYRDIFETYGFKTRVVDNTLLVFKHGVSEKDVEREFEEIVKLQKEGRLEKALAEALG